jgi:hypothetical protein
VSGSADERGADVPYVADTTLFNVAFKVDTMGESVGVNISVAMHCALFAPCIHLVFWGACRRLAYCWVGQLCARAYFWSLSDGRGAFWMDHEHPYYLLQMY